MQLISDFIPVIGGIAMTARFQMLDDRGWANKETINLFYLKVFIFYTIGPFIIFYSLIGGVHGIFALQFFPPRFTS